MELATEFYDVDSVAGAVTEFQEYLNGTWTIAGGGIQVRVTIRPLFDAHARKRIVREFLNYTLDLSLRKRFLGIMGQKP